MTGAEVGCSTDGATQAPHFGCSKQKIVQVRLKYGHGPESVPGLPALGPYDHCFPTGVNHSRPSGGSETISIAEDNSSKIQNHCQEPYYQAVPAGKPPPAGELAPTCLTPTKRPEAFWAPATPTSQG